MRYLTRPYLDNSWLTINDRLAGNRGDSELIEEMRDRVASVDIWFCDLGDNHAPSPAKEIVYNQLATSFTDPRFLKWAVTKGLPAKLIKSLEAKAWEDYVGQFLQDEDVLQKVQNYFTEERALDSLYQGVKEFQDLISNKQRFYVTRELEEVTSTYAKALGFNGFFSGVKDKDLVVENFILGNPWIRTIGVEGDSEEDAEMIEVAHFYHDRVDVVSIRSKDNPSKERKDYLFDYWTSKDRSGLVALMQGNFDLPWM